MRIRAHRFHRTSLVAGLWLSFLFLQTLPAPAGANTPVGACCLANGVCEDLVDVPCLEQGGTFVGADTTCANVDCRARVAAPVFSVLGIVGVVGALGGLGAYTLLRRRRQG